MEYPKCSDIPCGCQAGGCQAGGCQAGGCQRTLMTYAVRVYSILRHTLVFLIVRLMSNIVV